LPSEKVEEWEQHRDGVLRSLSPTGTLEQELAVRVALCLWRLRRVAAFETNTATASIEQVQEETERQMERKKDDSPFFEEPTDASKLAKAEKQLEKMRTQLAEAEQELALVEQLSGGAADATPVDGNTAGKVLEMIGSLVPEEDMVDATDDDSLIRLGVPKDELDDCWEWSGWTVGMVRKGLEQVGKQAKFPLAKLQARLTAWGPENVEEKRQEVRRLQKKVLPLRRRVKATEERARQQRILPGADELDKVLRYESHVSRQMLQALHTLERLQAARAGADVPPPAALDVNVNGPTPALEMVLENASRP
jgi:hypothetical protein